MIIKCPKCPCEMHIEQQVPPLPHALGIFDCPMCLQAFVLYQHPQGDVRAFEVTRTGTVRATS